MNLFCHNGAIAPIIKSLRKESVMQRIVHTNHGEPAEVLTLEAFSDAPSLVSGAALVRVSATPVHPGDLLGVSASPAFGVAALIPSAGRGPGVAGVGLADPLAADIDPA